MSDAGKLWNTIKRIANYSILTGTLALFSSSVAAAGTSGDCAVPQALTQAHRTVTQNGQVLAQGTVTLPDTLPRAWRNERVQIQYQLDVSACATHAGSGLWLFRVGAPFTISANDQPLVSLLHGDRLLADTSAFTGSQQPIINGRIPVLFALPLGAQSVQISLLTLPYISAGLTQVQMGSTNLLMPVANDALSNIVGYANAAAGVLLVLALIAFFLWLKRRKDQGLLWMSVACALWSLRALAYFDSSVDMPPLWFEQFNPLNIMLTSAALAAATVWTWAGSNNPRVWRALLGMSALSTTALLITTLWGQGALAARALAQLFSFVMVLWTIVWVWRRKTHIAPRHRRALLAGYIALMACALHDIMLVTGPIAPTGPTYLFWGFTVLLVAFAIISGEYITTTLSLAERSNEELASRVQAKSEELAQSYVQLRDTEVASAREAARAQERERLLRDMHDGMGAQLMTALRGVERGTLNSAQVAQSLQDGLDELRLLMDSTELGHPLPNALATWRHRWDTRLSAAGLTLHWFVDDALDTLVLPGDTTFQVLRILQEAAANVLKHARATHMALHASLDTIGGVPQLRITLTDDGQGMGTEPVRPGARGLKNMAYRAQQIGAQFSVGPAKREANGAGTEAAGGCQVTLSLALKGPEVPVKQ